MRLLGNYTSAGVIFVNSEWESLPFRQGSCYFCQDQRGYRSKQNLRSLNQVLSTLVFWYIQVARVMFITLAEV